MQRAHRAAPDLHRTVIGALLLVIVALILAAV